MADAESETVRTQRTRERVAQAALETVAEGGPLAGVLEFLCRTIEEELLDRVIACIHPVNDDATMFRDAAALGRLLRTREKYITAKAASICCGAAAGANTSGLVRQKCHACQETSGFCPILLI